MNINFDKLQNLDKNKNIHPRDIFMSLSLSDTKYEYPRDVQTEVWNKWFDNRNKKNNTIKMNTGSGKTIVGLLILQSCLNEGIGPAVYVVPDKYLVKQVCKEAEVLGINVSYDQEDKDIKGEENYRFKTGNSILVTTIHKLVNGKSVFGLRKENNIKIGSIIIDDVHSCLNTIKKQHTVFIDNKNALYGEIIEIISSHKEIKDNQNYVDIIEGRSKGDSFLLPFWIWQNECSGIYDLFFDDRYENNTYNLFNIPLMRDNWKTANCVISEYGIEISLKGIPINKIIEFENAKRRIFMSATLEDDSVFVTTLGLDEEDLSNVISPSKADDIGERLIIYPQYFNPAITDIDIRTKLIDLSREFNVVVLVPSFERAKFWEGYGRVQSLSSRDNNIEQGINELKSGDFKGITILVNKYDGIDLPGDCCRILVIDGIPKPGTQYDDVIISMNPGDSRIIRDRVQKIEQGMGRGVRSKSDYCGIVFMGNQLIDLMENKRGDKFFSDATLQQLNLSKKIWSQLMEGDNSPSIDEIFELLNFILDRDKAWINVSKSTLSNCRYTSKINVDPVVIALRKAFEKECLFDYRSAYNFIDDAKNKLESKEDKFTKGLLKQFMAEYKNFENPTEAQEILLSARNLNNSLTRPMQGITFEKLTCPTGSQAIRVIEYIKEYGFSRNEYIIHINAILNDLKFASHSSNAFEKALKDIGEVLGIPSSRPEKEFGNKAPDNLFALRNSKYILFECKNRTVVSDISKDDNGQLLNSVEWFKKKYQTGEQCYPVMIHNSHVFSNNASPGQDFKIMTSGLLDKFKESVDKFASSLFENGNLDNAKNVEKLLKDLHLYDKMILDKYTKVYKEIE